MKRSESSLEVGGEKLILKVSNVHMKKHKKKTLSVFIVLKHWYWLRKNQCENFFNLQQRLQKNQIFNIAYPLEELFFKISQNDFINVACSAGSYSVIVAILSCLAIAFPWQFK